MNNYVLESISKTLKVTYITEYNGYSFLSKSNGIKEISIIDYDIASMVVKSKFLKQYRRLLSIVCHVISDEDTTEGDILVTFTELDRLEDILMYKYSKYLKKVEIEKFLKQIKLLDAELKKVNVLNERKGMSR
ncbi:MAG: hypothetical protein RSE17_01315 [Bacilli bacterium]